jgi:hypothetical protein
MKPTSLDLSLFRWIRSQTSDQDRLALLSIREAVSANKKSYFYLEVGSHLGGSLQPHVADTRCSKIYSIDPRPAEQPDERWKQNYKYEGNSTQRMMDQLSSIPNADLSKIQTFEKSSWELSSTSISDPIDFAFIDGEHTNPAVLRDYHAVRPFLAPTSVLAFHDCFVTPKAIFQISRSLKHEKSEHTFLYFPESYVVAIVFGSDELAKNLIKYGWQVRLPFSRFYIFKNWLKKQFPRLLSRSRPLPAN